MEPIFTDPEIPRYTEIPFPAYRYLPFVAGIPHPRRDPEGHSYDNEEEYLARFAADDWRNCQPYLYSIDLFNYGYWWEAHETWEVVWLAARQETLTGNFVQGLIQVAAAQLKRFIDEPRGAQLLTKTGLAKLQVAESICLGIEIAPFTTEVQRCLSENAGAYPQIRLIF